MAMKTDNHPQVSPLTQTSTAGESVGGDDSGCANGEGGGQNVTARFVRNAKGG
uniref:Uncharacterized protein n=1 Tax=Cucumis melo TaxID=3656 RepID=A0A9I9CXV9_CUCME